MVGEYGLRALKNEKKKKLVLSLLTDISILPVYL